MDTLGLLAQRGLVTDEDSAAIKKELEATSTTNVEAILEKRGISLDDVLAIKAEYYHVPTRQLGAEAIPFEILKYIPEESAMHYQIVPLAVEDGVLAVGAVDPDNIEALDALNFISGKASVPFKVYLISETDFEKVIQMYKGISGEVGRALSELENELSGEGDDGSASAVETELPPAPGEEEEKVIREDAPVTKIVATILRNAVEGNASDIHIEPTGDKVRVRFRFDGELHTSITLPVAMLRAVVARIKVLSSMKLDERRKPQDGRFSATIDKRRIDFRVSTLPTAHGEKVVMRVLDREAGFADLGAIGLSKENQDAVLRAIKQPYGLILVSGPTGSGKSTTLYSMLQYVDRETNNVISLEDPVEYSIEGMNQSQVRPEIGYTFAAGLRHVLRQDPDIIMVGEIRDKETAQLAIQAALTGHLVLSTIHTNDAVGVIPRLIDMGVDPYLIAPTLILVIAQRLARRLCDGTGRAIPIESSLRLMLEKQFSDLPKEYQKIVQEAKSVYGIEPSDTCPSGTRGRVGVFELLEMNSALEQAILSGNDDIKIRSIARAKGMLSMKEDAIIKAINRLIPFEEVNTVTGDVGENTSEEEKPETGEA